MIRMMLKEIWFEPEEFFEGLVTIVLFLLVIGFVGEVAK
jgi:hypothetical protein